MGKMFVKFGGSSGEGGCYLENFKVPGLKYLLEFWEKILQWRLCCIGTTHSKSGLSQGQKGGNFLFRKLELLLLEWLFQAPCTWLRMVGLFSPNSLDLGVFRVIRCIPPTPLAKYLGGVSEVLAHYAHFFFLSSGTAWGRRRLLMLTSTFIAAWRLGEGLPTPNLRRRAGPSWGFEILELLY